MLHNRLSVNVTSAQGIINAILAFVTDVAWVAPWTEDPAYTAGANPGELVLQTSGGTPMWLYAQVIGDFLHIGPMQVNTNWNTGVPPSNTEYIQTNGGAMQYGAGLQAPIAAGYNGTLHMVADNDRIIILYQREPEDTWWLLYCGLYQPLCAPADDTNPVIVAGNMAKSQSGLVSVPTETTPGFSLNGRFPNVVLKFDPLGRRRYMVHVDESTWAGGQIDTVPYKNMRIPKNDRAAAEQIFSFAQYLTVAEDGRGEVISLAGAAGNDGILRTTDDLEPLTQVTIGADTYLVAPMSMVAGAHDDACVLIGPLGVAI